jgi:hypothetical protein
MPRHVVHPLSIYRAYEAVRQAPGRTILRDRGSVAGSLRQRGIDSWQLRVHAGRDPKTNRKRYVAQTVHGTKRQAERALAQLVTETESFTPRPSAESTLKILLREWLDHAAPDFSPKTVSTTRGYINTTINPLIGDIQKALRGQASTRKAYSKGSRWTSRNFRSVQSMCSDRRECPARSNRSDTDPAAWLHGWLHKAIHSPAAT